jgi:redox-sensitive bicupin YhaK (pirin superfamily)
MGDFNGARSPARRDSELVGVDVRVRGFSQMALEPTFEYGVIVLEGLIELEGQDLGPGTMGYLGPGRDELLLRARQPSTVIVLGGVPLEHEIFMWWNFVARTRAEIDAAYDSWRDNDGRFGQVDSPLARFETVAPYWQSRKS